MEPPKRLPTEAGLIRLRRDVVARVAAENPDRRPCPDLRQFAEVIHVASAILALAGWGFLLWLAGSGHLPNGLVEDDRHRHSRHDKTAVSVVLRGVVEDE